MGAWSEGPTENDLAQEWIANSIDMTIVGAISDALQRFFVDPADDLRKCEAEAAIAVLLDLTGDMRGLKYMRFHIRSIANEVGLWDSAIRAIKTLQGDTKWLASWTNPEKKGAMLSHLHAELEMESCRGR